VGGEIRLVVGSKWLYAVELRLKYAELWFFVRTSAKSLFSRCEMVDPGWTDLAKVEEKDTELCFLKVLFKFCRPPHFKLLLFVMI
jgi:hypothetical protein